MGTLENPLPNIEDAKHNGQLRYCSHALQRMIERGFRVAQIETALNCTDVQVIENYPEVGRPSPECLILGVDGNGKFIHVLVAYPIAEVITVYEPTLPKWKNPKERNRKNEV